MTSTVKNTPEYWKKACEYLSQKDKIIFSIINNYKGEILHSKGEAFYTLSRAIVGQQISIKAADTIWSRFENLCGGEPYPAIILGLGNEQLRASGFSASKVKYMRALAEEFACSRISHHMLENMSDDEIRAKLLPLPGIGHWTIEMFLIFCMLRPDVFPVNDLGVQKSIIRNYSNQFTNPNPQEYKKILKDININEISDNWRPYRTVATWYLWRSLAPTPISY